MAGLFATWQPEYASLGIATFPFDATEEVKRGPLVSHYPRIGLPASRQIAFRFPDAPGLAAMAGERNKFTIIDIDERGAAGERLLGDVERQFGAPKVVVRTGKDGFHCYYRHNGESRKIRPDARKPIDLIGGGPIVLPPSRGFLHPYEIVQGSIEDLAALEPIRPQTEDQPDAAIDLRSVRRGERDQKFFRYVARYAHQAKSLDDLLDHAREINEMMPEPLSDAEVLAKCKYWWGKTQEGENWYGVGQYVRSTHAEIDSMLTNLGDQDALLVLTYLRRHHWGRDFHLGNAMHASLGWTVKRFTAARRRLIEMGHVMVLRPPTTKKPMLCRLPGP
jgi:hypothetical protein